MVSLKDLIDLAKADGGKFFVMDESGEIKLVLMPMEEYQRLLLGKLHKQILDVERINREITKAQLEGETEPGIDRKSGIAAANERLFEEVIQKKVKKIAVPPPRVSSPIVKTDQAPLPDSRAEVIDPSFDFEGPKMDLEDI